jgi:internalin A
MDRERLLAIIQKTKEENWTELNLSKQNITELPPEIVQLTNLQSLDLSNNQLSSLPSKIGQLTALKYLNLFNNQLSSLPSEIGQLTALKYLNLFNNQLSSLPSEIGQLTNLRQLSLIRNQLSSLPSEIDQLINLQLLDLSNNQLSSLPLEINLLKNLQILDLRNNHLPLPEKIAKLKRQGEGIYIPQYSHDVPEEFLEKTFWDICHYLFIDKRKLQPLNEAKLLLVGDGAVGKTCLVTRLLHDRFEEKCKTEGIDRHKWENLRVNNHWIKLNIWDFGGQEILHATHQFFLTKRSLYVLVLDARRGEQESRLEYWLKLIQSFGGDSPILIAINKTDEEHRLSLNQRFLKEKYPNIQGFYPCSGKFGDGINELKQGIKRNIAKLPHIHDLMPASWFKLKEHLEQRPENYISYETYRNLCVKYEIKEQGSQDTLCGFLHDLGIVLNFSDDQRFDRLRETNVLNPEWVTNAVYKLLNNLELFKNHGVFNVSNLATMLDLDCYPSIKEHQFIINMMEKFELCFPIPDQQSYLIPELLQNEEPDLNWDKNDSLRFEYHYDILPHSVFSRFIVRLHTLISKSTYWRTGVVLTYENDKNKALIKADIEDKKIFIFINGNLSTRRELLAIIRKDFNHIHSTIKGLDAKEKVPYKQVVIDYQYLLDLEEMGETSFIPEGLKERVLIKDLLAGVDTNKTEDKTMIKKRIFLASSSELKTDREQFEIFISRQNKRLIDKGFFLELVLWEDFLDAMSQTRLQDEYNIAIKECDIFIMLFCTKVGKYTDEEFETAFGQFKENNKPIIFTYFKEMPILTTDLNENVLSLFEFKKKLQDLGHFVTIYKSIEDLQHQFSNQLIKLGINY